MREVKLIVKVVTPLFMGGANQQAELRSQSIKGVLRYWWRALKANNDIKKMKKEETKIFGGHLEKNKELEAISSNIILKIDIEGSNKGNDIRNDFNLRWAFNKEDKKLLGDHYGIGYLFYSVLGRQYYKPDNKFNIKIYSRNEEYLKQALAALWCAIYLGGFGARSRRGAGSCIVTNISGNLTDISFVPDQENVIDWFKENFEKCKSLLADSSKSFVHQYSNLSISRILVSRTSFNTWSEALNDLGKKYADFRYKNKQKVFDVGAFGLPVIHNNKQKLLAIKNINNNNKKEFINRRSSPLIFKIIEVNKKFYWVVVRLAGEFLPNGYVLDFGGEKQKVDYTLIDVFWNTLKQNADECIINLPKDIIDLKKKVMNSGAKKMILFGSKARGDFKEKSDIDLAVDGKLSLDLIGNYDIVNLNNIDETFKKKIESEGINL